jgi:hypothetical protein
MSRNRDHRYYEDSDDMVERIRRAREAFEKKTNAFQGPDWPHYEKRVIVGQKKKENMDPSLFQRVSVAVSSSSSSQPNRAPENDPATTADQTSSWWAAHREAQKASATAETTDQSATATDRIDDKAAS